MRNNLTAKYGVELAPTAIFDYPTVAALATFIASRQPAAAQAAAPEEEYWSSEEEQEETAPGIDMDAIRFAHSFTLHSAPGAM